MPTSSAHMLTPVMSFVGWLNPRSVLDLGCGYGHWGTLLRQYLDHPWVIESGRPRWDRQIDAVEVWDGYHNPLWEFAYDRLVISDALDFLPKVPDAEYDLILCIEVLEHLPPEDGDRLLRHLRRTATHVLVTTPDQPVHQHDLCSNPHETHLSWWSWRALRRVGAVARLPAAGSTIAVFSNQPQQLEPWLRSVRLRTLGPLVPPRLRRFAQVALHRMGLHPGPPSLGTGPPIVRVE